MVSCIFNTSISPTTIIDAVIESTNDKIFRSIICDGICRYYKNTKDFTFIQNIRDKLMIKKKPPNTQDIDHLKISTSNMINYEFFNIDDLICKTMQYLDFQSLISCRLINKLFLYLTYNTSSTTYLDIHNLFDIDNPKNVSELLRFKQVSKIKLEPWGSKLNDLFKHLSTFKKLSNIIITSFGTKNGYSDRFGKSSAQMIENNNDKWFDGL